MLFGATPRARDSASQSLLVEQDTPSRESAPSAGRLIIVAMIVAPLLFWIAVIAGVIAWLI